MLLGKRRDCLGFAFAESFSLSVSLAGDGNVLRMAQHLFIHFEDFLASLTRKALVGFLALAGFVMLAVL